MFGHQFYNQTIRKYVIAFGTLFNDIVVRRFDTNGVSIQAIRVPIAYGPKEKFLVRITENPNLDPALRITLPRMGFDIQSVAYDPTRKLQRTIKNTQISGTDKTVLKSQFLPVPYNIGMRLSVFAKNADDAAQIIEQILPYFQPEWTMTLNLIPEMSLKYDVPVILNGTNLDDAYEGNFETRRSLIWDLDFIIKGYFFGPQTTAGIITRTQVDLHANTAVTTPRIDRVVITPGLLANGEPTSNSAVTIPRNSISANDNFGFINDIFTYQDGLVYDPESGGDTSGTP